MEAVGFLPGDDWEAEYDAMTKGGQLFFHTLAVYLNYFPGRCAVPISACGPSVINWTHAWAELGNALGLTASPQVGEKARFTVEGVGIVAAVVDFVNQNAVGLRSSDSLYRFVRGFHANAMIANHHVFADGIDQQYVTDVWNSWLGSASS